MNITIKNNGGNKIEQDRINYGRSEKANISKKDADTAVNAVIDTIVETLAKDEKVQLVGFGTFEVRSRSERQGRDPRTNSPITIPASKVPAFKVGKALRALSTNKKAFIRKALERKSRAFLLSSNRGV